MTISGNSFTCHSCSNTIERLEPIQDEIEQNGTSLTFIKSSELPEGKENNPEQTQEKSIMRTNSPERQDLHDDPEIANNNQQYTQGQKANQKNSKKATQKANLDPFPTHKQPTSEHIEQDEVATVKLEEIRERELKLRKAEEHLKMKEKIFKDEQSQIVLLETRCQYLESKNCELESLVNTMKRRLDMNTNTNNIQGRKSATKVAESLNIPDARQDIHHESKGINPSYENDQENRRAAMNIATTGSKSAPTNPEAIQNIHNNGVTQAYRMNYPPRMETTSNYPGCNVLTSGYNVNGHREQIIEPDAPNNNDTDRYNFPPHI
ncbi:unnamed protein product [Mytilus coruscus]|uniref:Uncharacterized protein n=1 Tax=Mytilus coruscus TaxID=42192 RepID=A0A6J8DV23_MYTCO|nr:unnamed protein product [Mytilus coruscus]